MKIKHLNKTALILFLFFICCLKEKDQNKPNDIPIEKYKKEILMNGNIDAYKQLTLYYLNSPFHNETLPYSILMADKYNNGDACHEIFVQIIGLKQAPGTQHYDISIFNKLNKGEKEYVLFYLKKGARLKNIGCIVVLRDLGISDKD
ncbi:hypothetical protein [Chryseobacterium sp. JM1]|uniref:hypothetical protein n=1 Tax=Chryseobacterium sp. JM1 TaxID=1233950 RepID=UPI0004E70E0C|nr:hypothetical protein [Chryseobacterium sp. JM1]KFF16180.1 hypothetical protein IW22_23060 [Chryseobacterium sp. JM1]